MRLRDTAWSRKAQVVGTPHPRSYLFKTEDQKLLRRNRRHLLQTGERFFVASDDNIDTGPADTDVGDRPRVATSTSPANCRHRQIPTSGDPLPPVARQSTPPSTPELRRPTRTVKPPKRLRYDQEFNQVSDIDFT
ncbi:hypothetical protein MTO96_003226 [Rhipicephalus appendiculatus]